ncbi:S1 family peptidase [Corynebacterium auriscanis]|uniref:Peptidase S1 domain-containing protein n=1 Tax=Corynebacterium auriscanis TaxID=99807 RepID=A0A0A2DMX1_9CORY|nr:trypsin-like serine protease [Corynebacterium auriscanis]KGM18246.1 hypothetical protein MA47_09240 [Corynebacterium auriscanis]WJY72273.1 Trypsin [Corynebacterium auriscanis]
MVSTFLHRINPLCRKNRTHAKNAALGSIATAVLFTITVVTGSALPEIPAAQAISKGEKATRPDVVQIHIYDKPDGTPHRCTGTALNDQWILTAAHCVEGETYSSPDVPVDVLKVFYSNNKEQPGAATRVDKYVKHSHADIALLHVATAHQLHNYPTLLDNHPFVKDQKVELYGYGKGFQDAPVTWLRKAELKVIGQEDHINAGHVFVMRGVTGGSNHGDSGGPVFDDKGRIMGVNVIGSHSVWADPYAESKAVDVQHYADWVRETTGIKPASNQAPTRPGANLSARLSSF